MIRSFPVGFLYITGRIKEILITRGGENIAPVPIEEKMLDTMKMLSYCMVIGDNQKYLTMVVTLRCEVRGSCEWSCDIMMVITRGHVKCMSGHVIRVLCMWLAMEWLVVSVDILVFLTDDSRQHGYREAGFLCSDCPAADRLPSNYWCVCVCACVRACVCVYHNSHFYSYQVLCANYDH